MKGVDGKNATTVLSPYYLVIPVHKTKPTAAADIVVDFPTYVRQKNA